MAWLQRTRRLPGGSIANAAPPGTSYNYGTPQGPVQRGVLRPRPYNMESVYGYQGQHDTNEGGQMTMGPNGVPRLGVFSQPAVVGGKPQYLPSPQFQRQVVLDDADMRWNQQNANEVARQSGGASFGFGGRVLPTQDGRLLTDGGMMGGAYGRPGALSSGMPQLDARVQGALSGRPMQGIPLEQQGFARGQGFGQYGQALPGSPQQPMGVPSGGGAINGAMYGQSQGDMGPDMPMGGNAGSTGLRNRREYNIAQGNANGLARQGGQANIDTAGADGKPDSHGNVYQGQYAGGAVLRTLPDGTHQLTQSPFGKPFDTEATEKAGIAQSGSLGTSNQGAYQTFLRNKANNPAAYAKSQERRDKRLADQQAKRDAFALRQRGGRPLPMTPTTPTSPAAPPPPTVRPIDRAAPGVANSDPATWKALKLAAKSLAEAQGSDLSEALRHPDLNTPANEGGLSDEMKAKMRQEAQDWVTVKKRDKSPDKYIAEVEAILKGDMKTADMYRAERLKESEEQRKKDEQEGRVPGSSNQRGGNMSR